MTELSHRILVRAREILTPPGAWTKGALARNAQGYEVPATRHHEAVCFCTLGAIARAADEARAAGTIGTGMAEINATRLLNRTVKDRYAERFISVFNDAPDIGHRDVLSVFDATISNMEPTP